MSLGEKELNVERQEKSQLKCQESESSSVAAQRFPLDCVQRKGEENGKLPRLGLEDGLRLLEERIRQRLETSSYVVVEIAGGSASGKTSIVAKKILDDFKDGAVLISMDNYYIGAKFVEENNLNFDHPDSVEIDLLKEHLVLLKSGKAIEMPVYSFKTSEREPELKIRVEPKQVIIVEGLHALDTKIAPLGDIKVFVEVDTEGSIIRRLIRDRSRSAWTPKYTLAYFLNTALPMYFTHIEPTKQNADLIINNEYDPHKEAKNCGTCEVQVKYRGRVDTKRLDEIGAEKVASVMQQDEYYTTRNADEMMRIRNECGKIIFTYKGPKAGEGFIERHKLEFDIAAEIEKGMSSVYALSETITKERELYAFKGISFSIDLGVSKTKNGSVRLLGDFVEIKAPSENAKERMSELVSLLGLSSASPVTESYSEM